MASKAKVGRGTGVSIGGITGATGTETFVRIGELMNTSFSGSAWGTTDVSNFDSGVDEEFVATMRNNGEVGLEGNVIDADTGQIALQAAYNSGSKYDFKVQLLPGPGQTTGTLYVFSALVTSYEEKISTKDAVTFSSKLKVSGPITPTPGS